MRPDIYEGRRLALGKQVQGDFERLHDASLAGLRALEMLWKGSSLDEGAVENDLPARGTSLNKRKEPRGFKTPAGDETQPVFGTQRSETQPRR